MQPTAEMASRAWIIGFDRVRRLLSEMFVDHGLSHLAIEHNPSNVTPKAAAREPSELR